MSGTLSFPVNIESIRFRPNSASSGSQTNTCYVTYNYAGNEALLFASGYPETSFMFVNQESADNIETARWQKVIPGLQIKHNKVAIGKLIANGVNPVHALDVNGTSYFSEQMYAKSWVIMSQTPTSYPITWYNTGTRV